MESKKNGFLCLTGRPGELIHIGDDIVISINKVMGNQVQINFSAPKNITIDRHKIWEKKQLIKYKTKELKKVA